MADYRQIRTRPVPEFELFNVDKQAVHDVFERVQAQGRLSIGDAEAREILEAYGM